ncbi:MAG TPA: hypothetical protein VFI11_01970 [Anaerolineales bacterium]|nr:hypothetical protein [Anaerolineales bacterium]
MRVAEKNVHGGSFRRWSVEAPIRPSPAERERGGGEGRYLHPIPKPPTDAQALGSQILAAGPEWPGSRATPPAVNWIVIVAIAGAALVGLLLMVPLIRGWLKR